MVSTISVIGGVEEFLALRGGFAREDRRAGKEEFGDDAEHGGPQMLPLAFALGHRDEIRREEHAADAGQLHQGLGERRALGLLRVQSFERARVQDRAAGQEFEGGRVRRGFGLDEHGPGSFSRYDVNRRAGQGVQVAAGLPLPLFSRLNLNSHVD